MTKRILGVVAVFGLGVGFGCAAAPLVVPKASAQQAAALTKWEMTCVAVLTGSPGGVAENATEAGQRLGRESWEPVGGDSTVWCFKRPKM